MAIAHQRLVPHARRVEERADAHRELIRREPRDVLRVEPVELLGVEDDVATADAVEREDGAELLTREQLLVRARRPAEQREKVHHRLGQVPLPRVLHD